MAEGYLTKVKSMLGDKLPEFYQSEVSAQDAGEQLTDLIERAVKHEASLNN